MFRQRVLSAVVIVIAAIIPAVLGHPLLTAALILLAVLGIMEFSRAVSTIDVNLLATPTIATSAALILAAGFAGSAAGLLAVAILGSLAIFVGAIFRGTIAGATRDCAFSLAAMLYIGLTLAHLPMVRSLGDHDTASWFQSVNNLSILEAPAEGLGWLVLIVAATWMTDSAAYLGGRTFGSNKLAPTLSPAKTIEGAVAGLIAGAFTGAAVAALLSLPLPLVVGAVIGLAISAVGQAGDLTESLIKRDLGIKDMGDLIPGHGGILDRIDALLFTVPAGYYLIIVAMKVNWP